MNLLTGEAGLGEFWAGWPQGIAPLGLLQIRVSQVPRSICRHPPSSTTPGVPPLHLLVAWRWIAGFAPFGKVGHSQLLGFKAVPKITSATWMMTMGPNGVVPIRQDRARLEPGPSLVCRPHLPPRGVLLRTRFAWQWNPGSSGFRVGKNPVVEAICVHGLGNATGFLRRQRLSGGRDQQDPQVPPPKPPTPFPSSLFPRRIPRCQRKSGNHRLPRGPGHA